MRLCSLTSAIREFANSEPVTPYGLARERSRLAKIEGTVSWESIKHELTDAELEALEDAEDLRVGLERLRRVKTEGTIPWEAVKAKYGL